MQRTRVKICGITSPADAILAVQEGADAIGLVFYEASPRAVSIQQAKQICQHLPPFVTVVALTVDASIDFLNELLVELPTVLLQFHGNESASFCEQFKRPYYKAIRMRPDIDLENVFAEYRHASAILLDTYQKGTPGGTGESFDWHRVPSSSCLPIILAGGLTPDNVAQAISIARPYAVDVSGGVEARHGVKSADKVAAFIHAVSS